MLSEMRLSFRYDIMQLNDYLFNAKKMGMRRFIHKIRDKLTESILARNDRLSVKDQSLDISHFLSI